MRLHRLSLTAIGPFPNRVDIDFAQLGASGLFLLEGPTGSGKSTIIDGISFALYGKVAQSSAVLERMKSDHAAPGTEPVAELVFETHSGVYRIRRTPSHRRQKKRGPGTTPANMTVKLWRLGSADDDRVNQSAGELLANNLGDTEDEITRAIGLTHAQFVQTVVLPQGEFAQFLQSRTDDKKALLQRLFGTEVLAGMQAKLIEGRRAAEQRRSTAAAAVDRAMHGFVAAAGADDATADQLAGFLDLGDQPAATAIVGEVRATVTATEQHCLAANTTAGSARMAAQAALLGAQELHRRSTRREMLRSEQATLASTQQAIDRERETLSAAERALAAASSAEALAKAITRSDHAQRADEHARGALPAELAGADEAAVRAAAGERRELLGSLATEAGREQQLVGLRAEQTDLSEQVADLTCSIGRAGDELESLPIAAAERVTERESLLQLAARASTVADELQRAQHRLVAANQALEAERVAAEEEQITLAALHAFQQQQSVLVSLRNNWTLSVAAQLGLALKTGDPCAVCGSVEHPHPAAPGPDYVTQDDVDGADAELKRKQQTLLDCQEQWNAQRAALAELRIAADSLSPELAQAKVDQLNRSVAECRSATVRITAVDAELADIKQQQQALTALLDKAKLETATLTERLAALAKKISRDEKSVAKARAEFETVAARTNALAAEVRALDAAAAAISAAADAVQTALDCGTAFAQALSAAEFTDEAAWQQAHRTSSEIAQLRRQVRAFDDQWSAVVAKLSEPDLTDTALDAELPDLATMTSTLHDAESVERDATAQFGAAHERAIETGRHADRFMHALADGAKVLTETAPAIRIGNLVAGLGDNQLRMELATYVLVRRFAEVVAAANTQLHRVSSGRYQLEHTSTRSGNARSGLGLVVLDQHTGKARDPGTLSGGETFYVSLALALGLADVVRSESGGVDLGTLFIDEGFGTLDAEVLDEVLSVLDSLRMGGRSVGLVSHVAELKARIPDRVEVRRNADGSSRLRLTA